MKTEQKTKKRKDCVGYTGSRDTCSMTTYSECDPQKCAFYKTKEESERGRRRSFERRRGIGGPFTDFDRKYLLEVKKEVCV